MAEEFLFPKTVTFFECDPAGVMFYGRVYDYAHAALEAMLAEKASGFPYFNHPEFAFPIALSEAVYHAPIRQGDKLIVATAKVKTGNHSFEMNYTGKNSEGKEVFFVKTVHICVSKNTGKKAELPDELKSF